MQHSTETAVPTPKPEHSKRVYGLDIVRALSILIVVAAHGGTYIYPYINSYYYTFPLIDSVTLFFVLSGFLIGGILIKIINKTEFGWKDLANFWVRRWFRTLPNYFLVLTGLTAYYFVLLKSDFTGIWKYFTFTQNVNSPLPNYYLFFSESWSLSIEEWFYFFIPLSLFIAFKFRTDKKKTIFFAALAFLVLITGFRIYKALRFGYVDYEFWNFNFRTVILTRIDSLMYGVIGAYYYYYYPEKWFSRKNLLFIGGVILLFLPQFLGPHYMLWFKLSLDSVGALMILPKMSSIIKGKGIVFRFLSFISAVSYSMYLINSTPMQKIVMKGVFNNIGFNYTDGAKYGWIAYFIYWGLTIIISYLMYALFEKPIMKLRDGKKTGVQLKYKAAKQYVTNTFRSKKSV
jgi:peptidoglycan/LPS O-acetylase OafA/YrhL